LDDEARKRLVAQLTQGFSEFTPGEHDLLQHVTGTILRMLSSADGVSTTLLMPDEEAYWNVGMDPESETPLEHKDKIFGLMLDQLIMGKLPSSASGPDRDAAGTEFMTLAGSPIELSCAGAEIFLTDIFGRKVKVGPTIVDTPKISCRRADNFLMWDEWGWI
jgi:hypothetical protein